LNQVQTKSIHKKKMWMKRRHKNEHNK
jgi:hypothetical protein